jgi:uncharacterized protein
MEIWYWLLIVFLLTYEPVYGYFDYQKFTARVRLHPEERVRYYKKVMVGLWVPTLVILGMVLMGPLTFVDIGLSGIQWNTKTLGPWVTYIACGLGIVYFLILIYYLVGSRVSEKLRNSLIQAQQQELEKNKFVDIIPVSKEDKKVWTFVSWTAGITEEIIYRGFLIYALTALFPSLSIWVILVLSALVFGLAHTYQGLGNVVRTSLIGLFFAILYIGLGSIIPLIVLHFLIDYVGKIGDEEE